MGLHIYVQLDRPIILHNLTEEFVHVCLNIRIVKHLVGQVLVWSDFERCLRNEELLVTLIAHGRKHLLGLLDGFVVLIPQSLRVSMQLRK